MTVHCQRRYKIRTELVSAAFDRLEQIDSVIQERAANWDLKRMAAIDRNILRLAVTGLRIIHRFLQRWLTSSGTR